MSGKKDNISENILKKPTEKEQSMKMSDFLELIKKNHHPNSTILPGNEEHSSTNSSGSSSSAIPTIPNNSNSKPKNCNSTNVVSNHKFISWNVNGIILFNNVYKIDYIRNTELVVWDKRQVLRI